MILTKTTGSYCLKNGFHTISYYELDEYGNTTDNFISLTEKEMQIRKSGSFSGQFIFVLDNRTLNWNPSFQFASLSSDLANRLHK